LSLYEIDYSLSNKKQLQNKGEKERIMIANGQPVALPLAQPLTQPIASPLIPPPPPPQPWKAKFPVIIAGILAFLQFGIAFVIIGLEIGSVLIDMVTATIYVGFWGGLFFIAAFSSLAGSCMYNY
jgi:hypothetical protein